MPIAVGANRRALNCYWPMPFHKHARIEIYNNGNRSIRRIYYNIDYEHGDGIAEFGLTGEMHGPWLGITFYF